MTTWIARDRAIRDIESLYLDDHISDDMRSRAISLVVYLFNPDTVYASITPDGPDVCFYWVAGDMQIGIDMYADTETMHQSARFGDQTHIYTSGIDPAMRRHLIRFSRVVNQANPLWEMQTR